MAIWETPEILSGPTPTMSAIGDAKPQVGLGLIHTGVVPFDWAISFRYLNIPFNHVFMHGSNMPYDCSREMVVKGLLGYNVEWVFFLDTDVLPPRDAVPQLMALSQQQNKPVVSGLYWAKKKEETPMPCAWIEIGRDPAKNQVSYKSIENEVKQYLDKNALLEVDVCGAGCLLIKADIFKKLDASNPNKPYFQWGLTRKDELTGKPLPQQSEDFYFCERLKEIGVKPHLATAVKCDHLLFPTGRRRAADGRIEL
jgi:hypothetical protein